MKALRTAGVHAALVVASIVTIYPVLWVVKMALSPSQGFSLSPSPWPTHVTLANFADVLGTHDDAGRWLFGRQLFNSLVVAAAVTALGVALACSAAYALSRFRFPGRQTSLRAFLVSQMFPGVVTSIPLYVLLDRLHLLNHMLGLVLVYATTAIPFCVFMLKGYFDTLPRELEEAVLLDGGTRFDAFWRVALPLSRPALITLAIIQFQGSWNDFLGPLLYLRDAKLLTLTVGLNYFKTQYAVEWNKILVGSMFNAIPILIIFFIFNKYYISGASYSGLAGQ